MQKRVIKELETLKEYAKNADIIKNMKVVNPCIIEMELHNSAHHTENLVVRFELPNDYPFKPFVVRIVNYKNFDNIHGSINPFDGIISDSTLVHLESLDSYKCSPGCTIKIWIEKYYSLVCEKVY